MELVDPHEFNLPSKVLYEADSIVEDAFDAKLFVREEPIKGMSKGKGKSGKAQNQRADTVWSRTFSGPYGPSPPLGAPDTTRDKAIVGTRNDPSASSGTASSNVPSESQSRSAGTGETPLSSSASFGAEKGVIPLEELEDDLVSAQASWDPSERDLKVYTRFLEYIWTVALKQPLETIYKIDDPTIRDHFCVGVYESIQRMYFFWEIMDELLPEQRRLVDKILNEEKTEPGVCPLDLYQPVADQFLLLLIEQREYLTSQAIFNMRSRLLPHLKDTELPVKHTLTPRPHAKTLTNGLYVPDLSDRGQDLSHRYDAIDDRVSELFTATNAVLADLPKSLTPEDCEYIEKIVKMLDLAFLDIKKIGEARKT